MHADRFRYSAVNCSIARTLGVVGEKWTLLILREAFYGVRRFDDFHTALGCARNLLAARLKTLVAHELLERVAYQDDGGRGRHGPGSAPKYRGCARSVRRNFGRSSPC